MSLYGTDLNLLVALDALLIEKHVGRAALRIGITQSAMSHTLRRLRDVFDDVLFVRRSGKMQATPRARGLAPVLRKCLEEIEHVVLGSPGFDPTQSDRKFRIGCESYFSAVVLPPLVQLLQIHAPSVKLSLHNVGVHSMQELNDDDIDVLVGVFPKSGDTEEAVLFEDCYSCLVRGTHSAIGEHLSVETYAGTPHVVVSIGKRGPTAVDRVLAETGLSREIALWVNDFLAAPLAVAASDLLFTCPSRLARMFSGVHGLRTMAVPIQLPDFEYGMHWLSSRTEDPAHTWLRELLVRAARTDGLFPQAASD